MKILVIGGTGFIGRRVALRLAEQGHSVVCADISPGQVSFAPMEERIQVLVGDVTRFDDLVKLLVERKIDRVINLAYLLGESDQNPHLAVRLNVLGMNNCFEAARLCGIKRVVYASSIAFHGHSQAAYGERPVTEDDPPHASGVYSACKQFNEFMAGHYSRLYGMEVIGVRPCWVIGEGKPRGVQDHHQVITVPALQQPLRSPLKASARFLVAYVEDIAEIFCAVTLAQTPRHLVYHTGGHSVTVGELAGLVRERLADAEISFDDESGSDGRLVYLVDNSRVRGEFEIEHRPLRQIVAQIIDGTRTVAGLPPLERP
jgi:nucleoside-diphosphate-sugar epimerase